MSKIPSVLGTLLFGTAILSGCQTKPVTPVPTAPFLAYERGDCATVNRWTSPVSLGSMEAGEAQHSLLLIHGFCQELAGDRSGATETYQGLVQDAPLSFAADDARERLRILRLVERDPDYQAWVAAARERAASGSSARAPVDRTAVDFPPLAEQAGIEGFAVVEFGVTPLGETDSPVVVDSHPPLLFDGAALRAVREWRYTKDSDSSKSQRQAIRIVFQPVRDPAPIPIPAQEPDAEASGAESTMQ